MSRPRTADDNERYDQITRKVIENQCVDPHDFSSVIDYLKWCDRVHGAAPGDPVVTDDRGYTALPYTHASGDYDKVKRLQG
jgi:hypothetical protein